MSETTFRISKVEYHSPMPGGSLSGEDLGATAEGLQEAVERWKLNAVASPDGMAVGFIRFTVEEDGRPAGIIDISTTDQELFITVPA